MSFLDISCRSCAVPKATDDSKQHLELWAMTYGEMPWKEFVSNIRFIFHNAIDFSMPLPDIGILDNVSQAINPTVTRYTISNSHGRRGARMSIQLDLEHGLWHSLAPAKATAFSAIWIHLKYIKLSNRIILESQLSPFPQQNCSILSRTKRQPAAGHGTRSTSPCPWDLGMMDEATFVDDGDQWMGV